MKKTSLLFLFASLIFISSCKKDPLACASSDKTSALTGESITYTNCSENALRISWDFGDGNTDEGNSVSHTYSKAGNYLVNMTAYSKKDKDWDKTTMLVTVSDPPVAPPPAKRYLTKIVLKSFAAKNGSSDWDSGAELLNNGAAPDVEVQFGLSTGEWTVTSSAVTDAITSGKTWNYTPQNIFLSSNNWDITLRDLDFVGSEEMQLWTINPATQTASNGVISLTSTSNSIDIYFEER